MSRRADLERIHLARRDAHLARLRDVLGIAPERAEELVAAWEAQADEEGREHGSTAFWEGLEPWVEERRR